MEYSNSVMMNLIEEYVHSKRDREILCLRLIDNVCFDALAIQYGLSERQVKNIVYKNQEILFKHYPK